MSATAISPLSFIFTADPIIKIVLLSLIFLSIVSWGIFFEKIIRFRALGRKHNEFEKKFWAGIMLEQFYEKNKRRLRHPLGLLFVAAMKEWLYSQKNNQSESINLLKDGMRARLSSVIEMEMVRIEAQVNKYIEFISVAASTSPFIGLFGTVWGIMNSFKAIAEVKNAGIHIVAPGIAEALITTGIGILVAVCCSILYAIANSLSQNIMNRSFYFSCEIMNILSRELDDASIDNFYQGKKNLNPPAVINASVDS